jgi:hypothetical protein
MLVFYQINELQDDNELLEQQAVNNLSTSWDSGNKQCEHILLASCWNSIARSLLEVCYNVCVLKTHKLLQVCKQVVTNMFTSCRQVVFALLVYN